MALAQVFRHHLAPAAILSNHSYSDNKGDCIGTHAVSDAGMGDYDWVNMPAFIDTGSDPAQIDAIARLIYHCAVVLEADFEGDGTTTYASDMPNALRTFFGLGASEVQDKDDYTSSQWYNRIAENIDLNMPILYGLWEDDGTPDGHFVVCDGYQNGDEIHLNLGWGGAGYNVWYDMDSVEVTTPSRSYSWTVHSAVFDISPPGTPPTVTFVMPTSGDTYVSERDVVYLHGTASAATGSVVRVTWANQTAGDSGVATGTDFWNTGGIDLDEGENVIVVTARDSSGRLGTRTMRVTYDTSTEKLNLHSIATTFFMSGTPKKSYGPDDIFVGYDPNTNALSQRSLVEPVTS